MRLGHQVLNGIGARFVSRQLRGVVRECCILLRHWRGLVRSRRLRSARDLKLHLGCGPNRKPGWINIDLTAGDLNLDLRKPLPFANGSCARIYSEHFFEHLDYPGAALGHLRDCFRALRPGGTLSIGVPDGETCLRWYIGNPDGAVDEVFQPQVHPAWVTTRMELTNFIFRQNYAEHDPEHRMAYDLFTLSRALTQVGFVNVRRRQFDPALDSESRRAGTLYVEASKL